MNSLLLLPPTLLNIITSVVDIDSICCLWLCGNRVLNWKLSKDGGVTSLRLLPDPVCHALWPNLVSQFDHLETLSVTAYGTNAQFEPNIRSMPRKLQNLSLDFDEDIFVFEDAVREDPEQFKHLKSLRVSGRGLKLAISMRLTLPLPNLTSLSVCPPSVVNEELYVANIPSQLTYLKCKYSSLHSLDDSIAFPAGLTSFSLEFQISCDFLHLLPRGLLKLRLRPQKQSLDLETEQYNWHNLPRTVTTLDIVCSQFSHDIVAALPNNLTKLRVLNMDESISDQKAIDICNSLSLRMRYIDGILPKTLSPPVAAALPRTLTKMGHYTEVTLESIPFLPPTLKNYKMIEN
jgi:hypothetical protein